jgi:hypothetical protein
MLSKQHFERCDISRCAQTSSYSHPEGGMDRGSRKVSFIAVVAGNEQAMSPLPVLRFCAPRRSPRCLSGAAWQRGSVAMRDEDRRSRISGIEGIPRCGTVSSQLLLRTGQGQGRGQGRGRGEMDSYRRAACQLAHSTACHVGIVPQGVAAFGRIYTAHTHTYRVRALSVVASMTVAAALRSSCSRANMLLNLQRPSLAWDTTH